MVLKGRDIAKLLKKGEKPGTKDPFVITPHADVEEIAKSGSASINLRLGTWFVTLERSRMRAWEIKKKGEPQQQIARAEHYIPFGNVYLLHPRSFVLGITLEWIRLPSNFAAYVIGKSSLGRRGLIIATATGVHPGFKGCLTLELSNVGEIPVAIKPGMEICQIFIHKTHKKDSKYIDRSQFVGSRKPRLGDVTLDEFAEKLTLSQEGNP